jgi:FkbM family methyltransferase
VQDFRNYAIKFRKLLAMARHPAYLRAFLRHRVAASIEHDAVLKSLPIGMVVDVGANRGQFSLAVSHWRPWIRIVAFEPLPAPAATYRSLFADNPHVTLHEVALASERGEMEMNISRRDDSSSLLPIADLQTWHFPGTERVAILKVPVAPLEDFLPAEDIGPGALLKIDVQGFELPVLQSAQTLLTRFAWVYAECSYVPLYEGQALADEIIAFLEERGFVLKARFNPSYGRAGGEMLQADLLFEKRA